MRDYVHQPTRSVCHPDESTYDFHPYHLGMCDNMPLPTNYVCQSGESPHHLSMCNNVPLLTDSYYHPDESSHHLSIYDNMHLPIGSVSHLGESPRDPDLIILAHVTMHLCLWFGHYIFNDQESLLAKVSPYP